MNKIIMTRSQLCAVGHMMPELLLDLGKHKMSVVRKGMDHIEFIFENPTLKLMTNRSLSRYCRLELGEET